MDTIFFNGCIRTLDDSEKVAEAVGIENGRIVFVGTDKEAEAFSCKKRIDLKGRLMLPGFVDTHMHMLHYAFVERSVKLFDCTSVEEMLAAAKKRLEESKGQKLTWLYCRGKATFVTHNFSNRISFLNIIDTIFKPRII